MTTAVRRCSSQTPWHSQWVGLLEGHHHPFAPQLAAGDPVGLVEAPAAPEGGGGGRTACG